MGWLQMQNYVLVCSLSFAIQIQMPSQEQIRATSFMFGIYRDISLYSPRHTLTHQRIYGRPHLVTLTKCKHQQIQSETRWESTVLVFKIQFQLYLAANQIQTYQPPDLQIITNGLTANVN